MNTKNHYSDKDSTIIKDTSTYSNIPPEYIAEAMKLSHKTFKLLIYYFSKAGSWKFNKQTMIRECGLTDRSFDDARRELIRTKWLIIDSSGHIDNIIIGKEKVGAYIRKLEVKRENISAYS